MDSLVPTALDQGTTVDDMLSNIVNTHPNNPNPYPQTELIDGIPLTKMVPQKIKNKIWQNEYVDFKTLLPSFKEDPWVANIAPGNINIQQSNSHKQSLTILQWVAAFNKFSAVLIEKIPDQAPHLLKYHSYTLDLHLHAQEGAWRTYDESFRMLRQSMGLPWNKWVDDLKWKATTSKSTQETNNFRFRRLRFCFDFNNGVPCTSSPCPYRHVCQLCRAPHPKLRCFKRPRSTVPTQGNSNTNPHPRTLVSTTQTNEPLPTLVNSYRLNEYLEGYNPQRRNELVKGFRFGFNLGCTLRPPPGVSQNHKSTREYPGVIPKYIAKGLERCRIACPFPTPPFDSFVVSPLGVIPKSSPGAFRVIHDMSFPRGSSVNEGIPSEHPQVSYDSIDTIIFGLWEINFGFGQCLTYWTISFSSALKTPRFGCHAMSFALREITKNRNKLTWAKNRRTMTLRELQSLIGLLNLACAVVLPGRAFLRRLINLTCKISYPFHHINLNREAQGDIHMWFKFLTSFNGISVFLNNNWLISDQIWLFTDASGTIDCAAVLGKKWFAFEWPFQLSHHQIAVKELFPIVLALEI
ncbi:uncharacterized protein LOC117108307 [Anneissia japonica]|uniref:uncharacterized protein LOC117108307 n=1 Tax=Anneissia japonica TaxID=1529436 RepID=UPI0014254F4C|nr:uncharacterized protein LOC117108307 [Anneissia japonica]